MVCAFHRYRDGEEARAIGISRLQRLILLNFLLCYRRVDTAALGLNRHGDTCSIRILVVNLEVDCGKSGWNKRTDNQSYGGENRAIASHTYPSAVGYQSSL